MATAMATQVSASTVCFKICQCSRLAHALLQEQGKGLEKLAKRFRHEISLIKNGVSTCFGLDGRAAIAKYNAGSAALVNSLDKEHELAEAAGVSLEQAFDLYEAELKQNRCAAPCCLPVTTLLYVAMHAMTYSASSEAPHCSGACNATILHYGHQSISSAGCCCLALCAFLPASFLEAEPGRMDAAFQG